jgi:hypothetical protein
MAGARSRGRLDAAEVIPALTERYYAAGPDLEMIEIQALVVKLAAANFAAASMPRIAFLATANHLSGHS